VIEQPAWECWKSALVWCRVFSLLNVLLLCMHVHGQCWPGIGQVLARFGQMIVVRYMAMLWQWFCHVVARFMAMCDQQFVSCCGRVFAMLVARFMAMLWPGIGHGMFMYWTCAMGSKGQ
jgi:hypothetical protein